MKKMIAFFACIILMFSVAFAESENTKFVFKMPHEVKATSDITGFPGDEAILGSYTGETIDGIPNGHGLFEFTDIAIHCHYLGEWENGEMSGFGGLYWAIGESMIGEFRSNVMVQGQIYKSPKNTFRDASAPKSVQETIPTYILNTNSHRFHLPSCDSVERTKEQNKKDYQGSREELISRGYSPCGSCNP